MYSSFKSYCTLFVALVSIQTASIVQAAPSADRLQVLISETSAQFQLAFRLHPGEGQQRQEQLKAAMAAWRTAPRTEANNEQFAAWLRLAIRSSMPGSRAAMPPLPLFKSIEQTVKRPVEATKVPIALTNVEVKQPTETMPAEAKRPVVATPAETRSEEPFEIEAYAVEPSLDANANPFRDDPIGEPKK